jgi:hypothetical protein
MDLLSRADLKALAEERSGLHVSLYAPTHRAGPETQQDPIRLKNLVGEAEKRLVAGGLGASDARELLGPAERLVQDSLFWRHQSDGLAVFLSAEASRHYRLPLPFEELLVVAGRFHIKPLLPLLSGDGRFYILAISQNEVRLLQATRYSVDEVDLEGVPTSLAQALRFDDPEKRLQFHTATCSPGSKSERPAMFHGHGVSVNDAKTDLLRYFHKVDAGLSELLGNEQVPLVLAGVDYLLPIYQEANTYPHLVVEGIAGSSEGISAEALHQQAWDIVQSRFLLAQNEASVRYSELAKTELASTSLERIVPAAYCAQVDTLFVALGVEQWGTFHAGSNAIRLHEKAKPGDDDLLDFAAVQTLLNGGTVYALNRDQIPGGALLAAVFRY